MAHKDDITRVMAVCDECGSVYAARQWPDGTIRIIGQEGCSCGATAFETVADYRSRSPLGRRTIGTGTDDCPRNGEDLVVQSQR